MPHMGGCPQMEPLRGIQPPAALSGAGACIWTSPAWHHHPSCVGVVPLVTPDATHRPALLPSWDCHSRSAPPCSCPSLPPTPHLLWAWVVILRGLMCTWALCPAVGVALRRMLFGAATLSQCLGG